MTASSHSIVVPETIAETTAQLSLHAGSQGCCADCASRTRCVVAALPARLHLPSITRFRLAPRQTLCREGEPFSSLYVVRSGAIKSLVTSEDGRQQIVAIHLPGEAIGAEGIASGRHSRTFIAVEESGVCVIGYASLDRLMAEVPSVRRWYQRALGNELARNAETVRWLRCATAEARLAGFLLDLSRRLSPGETTPEFTLSASRIDIAIHLGLTRETVSRAFGKLRSENLIDGDLTRVRLRNPLQLSRLAANRASNRDDARTGRDASAPAPPGSA